MKLEDLKIEPEDFPDVYYVEKDLGYIKTYSPKPTEDNILFLMNKHNELVKYLEERDERSI